MGLSSEDHDYSLQILQYIILYSIAYSCWEFSFWTSVLERPAKEPLPTTTSRSCWAWITKLRLLMSLIPSVNPDLVITVMITLCVCSLPVTALHLRDLSDADHDHVGRHLQRGRHQQPGRLHRGADGARRGAGRAAPGSGEAGTHGGPPVGEQRVHQHQKEEEPARPQHHPEHARHWQILPDVFPWFLHLFQPHLLVRLLLRDLRATRGAVVLEVCFCKGPVPQHVQLRDFGIYWALIRLFFFSPPCSNLNVH